MKPLCTEVYIKDSDVRRREGVHGIKNKSAKFIDYIYLKNKCLTKLYSSELKGYTSYFW